MTEFDETNNVLKVSALSDGIIPAATGVILEGTASTTYTLFPTSETAEVGDNLLKGTDEATTVTASNGYIYFFGYDSAYTPGFYEAEGKTSFTNGAHKAYIDINYDASSAGAKPLTLDFAGGTADAISSPDTAGEASTGHVYNMQGMKMGGGKLAKGLYIQNGRKFIVR